MKHWPASIAPADTPRDPELIASRLQRVANDAKKAGNYAEGDRIEASIKGWSGQTKRKPLKRDPVMRIATTPARARAVQALRDEAELALSESLPVQWAPVDGIEGVKDPGEEFYGRVNGLLRRPDDGTAAAAERMGLDPLAKAGSVSSFPPKAVKQVKAMPKQMIAEQVYAAARKRLQLWIVAQGMFGTREMLEAFEGVILDRWSMGRVCQHCGLSGSGRNQKSVAASIAVALDEVAAAMGKRVLRGA